MSVKGKFSPSGPGWRIGGGKWLTLLPGKNPGTHSLNRRLGEPRRPSGRFREEKNSCPLGVRTPDRPARSPVVTNLFTSILMMRVATHGHTLVIVCVAVCSSTPSLQPPSRHSIRHNGFARAELALTRPLPFRREESGTSDVRLCAVSPSSDVRQVIIRTGRGAKT